MTNPPPSENPENTVFIVDDDAGMRKGMDFLVSSAGYRCVSFASAEEFLEFLRPEMRGCLLLDVRMPGMGGLELQQELAARKLQLPVIIVTAFANVPMAVRAIQAGAFDFVEKPFEGSELLEHVRRALASERREWRDAEQLREIRERIASLTPREREVMDLVVAGRLNKEIAAELGISIKTVENHRACVMQKTRADSLATLVRMSLAAE
ncbi:MAG TPA: DNA-binding response regulator [Phycisphaerales bacterium]|nr:DNA-binding response regulator [Phycisphaerales bacterium]